MVSGKITIPHEHDQLLKVLKTCRMHNALTQPLESGIFNILEDEDLKFEEMNSKRFLACWCCLLLHMREAGNL